MTAKHHNALGVGHSLQGDRFQIEGILGQGGFGITYKAMDTLFRQPRAIKEYFPSEFAVRLEATRVCSKSADTEEDFAWGRKRFLEEGRTLIQFEDQPNIVRVIDYFEENETAYMIMAYYAGDSLQQRIRQRRTPSGETEILAFVTPLIDGLAAVHAKTVLHLDIKPANIYIRHDTQAPVLLDFGAAKLMASQHSKSVGSVYTPGYAPIEQYSQSGKRGPWTDIYGLGATLYQLVSGNPPEEAPGRVESDDVPLLVDTAEGDYSHEFLAAIDASLRVYGKDRPQSCADWKRMLLAGRLRATYGSSARRVFDADLVSSGGLSSAGNAPTSRDPARPSRDSGHSQPAGSLGDGAGTPFESARPSRDAAVPIPFDAARPSRDAAPARYESPRPSRGTGSTPPSGERTSREHPRPSSSPASAGDGTNSAAFDATAALTAQVQAPSSLPPMEQLPAYTPVETPAPHAPEVDRSYSRQQETEFWGGEPTRVTREPDDAPAEPTPSATRDSHPPHQEPAAPLRQTAAPLQPASPLQESLVPPQQTIAPQAERPAAMHETFETISHGRSIGPSPDGEPTRVSRETDDGARTVRTPINRWQDAPRDAPREDLVRPSAEVASGVEASDPRDAFDHHSTPDPRYSRAVSSASRAAQLDGTMGESRGSRREARSARSHSRQSESRHHADDRQRDHGADGASGTADLEFDAPARRTSRSRRERPTIADRPYQPARWHAPSPMLTLAAWLGAANAIAVVLQLISPFSPAVLGAIPGTASLAPMVQLPLLASLLGVITWGLFEGGASLVAGQRPQ
ncbi:MAG TPA: protein kinase [Candidatus Binatia bacterium]|nr:protein kinase [Candidatus Binatia bacterium]